MIESVCGLEIEGSAEICALCLQPELLKNSHVVPNAVFRAIKKANGTGNLISFDDSWPSLVTRSQESWSERLLCVECEQKIGRYEKYGIEALRKVFRSDAAGGMALFKPHDYKRMRIFLTSILWRATASKGAIFSAVSLPHDLYEEARISILKESPLRPPRLGCMISRMRDYSRADGFSDDNLRQIVVSPFRRNRKAGSSFVFVMEGFFLEFFYPSVPFRIFQGYGAHRDLESLLIPGKSIFEVKEFVDLLVAGYAKNIHGRVAPGV